MLTVTKLDKSFVTDAGTVHAVRDVSFQAAAGQMLAIIGPSGSGKSTLLSLLGLLDAPDSGSIEIDDAELGELGSKGRTEFRASGVGFIFQGFNPKENVLLALEYANWPKHERDARADEMLRMVGLDEAKSLRRPSRLSGGEQQRVAIARAFAAQPPLILADEPTGSLDRGTGQKIVALLRQAATQQQATVLVVTHDERVASQADRRLEIEDGVLTEME